MSDPIPAILSYLRARVPSLTTHGLDVAIVCGSGLSGLSSDIEDKIAIPYKDIPGFPLASVAGHGTELVFGTLGGVRVVAQRGRLHFYEGHTPSKVCLPVRVFASLGAKVMIATNAAGGVNKAFRVGDVMVIRDHISIPSISGAQHPLVGPNDARFGPRFPPMSAYSRDLAAIAAQATRDAGLGACLREGTYMHVSGPTYETPAEIAAFRLLGGDAVGMSTVPEVIAAAHAGMAVVGLSLITNECRAPGDTGVPPSHEEVLEATDKRAKEMQGLVGLLVARLPLADLPRPAATAHFSETGSVAAASLSTAVGAGASAPLANATPILSAAIIGGAVGALFVLAAQKVMKSQK